MQNLRVENLHPARDQSPVGPSGRSRLHSRRLGRGGRPLVSIFGVPVRRSHRCVRRQLMAGWCDDSSGST
jgi:hypothetical protein